VERGDFLTELINCRCAGFYYGHCGKKFSEKVPGEVSQSPAPGADTETFVKSTETNTRRWPLGHVKEAFDGGSISREPLIEPFLPDVNVPCAVTVPVTVDLLAALGAFLPMVQAGVYSATIGRSRYRKRLISTESRYPEGHVQASIRVNAACAASEEVGVLRPHGGSHEAEGDHGTGENA
jgi:hypothetical protein